MKSLTHTQRLLSNVSYLRKKQQQQQSIQGTLS